jgi:DASS family divalent anion:Na+ symporter
MSESLGSHAEKPSSKKIGAFLIQVAFHCGLVTSAMFFTAMAGNPLAQKIAFDTCKVTITWSSWFMGAIVPGLISLILIPLVLYWIYPPEMKHIPDAIAVANKKLHTLGKVKKDEWIMLGTFAGMLFLWINGVNWGIDPATTALAGVSILFLTNILTIEDLLKEHEAWHTLIWYAIIVSMAKYLQDFGFVGWFSGHIGTFFSGYDWPIAFLGLTLVYFYSHYFLASNAAHIGAMYGAFLMSAIAVGTPPLLAALVLGYSSSLFSHMTQYGSASAVVFFGGGYVPVGKWWKLGLIISILNIAIWGGVGSLWWKYLGLL